MPGRYRRDRSTADDAAVRGSNFVVLCLHGSFLSNGSRETQLQRWLSFRFFERNGSHDGTPGWSLVGRPAVFGHKNQSVGRTYHRGFNGWTKQSTIRWRGFSWGYCRARISRRFDWVLIGQNRSLVNDLLTDDGFNWRTAYFRFCFDRWLFRAGVFNDDWFRNRNNHFAAACTTRRCWSWFGFWRGSSFNNNRRAADGLWFWFWRGFRCGDARGTLSCSRFGDGCSLWRWTFASWRGSGRFFLFALFATLSVEKLAKDAALEFDS